MARKKIMPEQNAPEQQAQQMPPMPPSGQMPQMGAQPMPQQMPPMGAQPGEIGGMTVPPPQKPGMDLFNRMAKLDGTDQRAPQPQGMEQVGFVPEEESKPATKLTEERVHKMWTVLTRYKSGKANLDARVIECEQWWKMRHWGWMGEQGNHHMMRTPSAWLFNTVMAKHADAMDNLPMANILPREEQDKDTAEKLSAIVPCILEQAGFAEVYSDVMWQKLKTGTGVYGVFWDKSKLNGLGDIAIKKINLLNVFWEPGVTDIQESENLFLIESVDREKVKSMYPQVTDEMLSGQSVVTRHFVQDEEHRNEEDRVSLIDWYYHAYDGGKAVLHYAKLMGENVLYSSEDDPEYAERGWYDHGLYPFVFDRMFPVETSPCGFGFVDVCKHNQEQIDLLEQALVQNSLMNAVPRYFVRTDGGVNEQEFADWARPIVHVSGSMSADSVASIQAPALNGNVISMVQSKVNEMKETSGNTNSSNGVTSGVTSASGIAALQEASGKTSRDASLSSFRAFTRLVNLVVELIRQFYDAPRQFRILGENGKESFTDFDNMGMQPQSLGIAWGEDQGYRLPTFDIKISAEAHSAFTRNATNEMAMNLYNMGVFNPQQVDQSLMLLDMMQFEGKQALMSKLSEMGTMQQQLLQWQQMALQLAQQVDPAMAEQMGGAIMAGAGQAPMPQGGGDGGMQQQKDPGGAQTKMENARKLAQEHSKP